MMIKIIKTTIMQAIGIVILMAVITTVVVLGQYSIMQVVARHAVNKSHLPDIQQQQLDELRRIRIAVEREHGGE